MASEYPHLPATGHWQPATTAQPPYCSGQHVSMMMIGSVGLALPFEI